jgi:hypothetical protein
MADAMTMPTIEAPTVAASSADAVRAHLAPRRAPKPAAATPAPASAPPPAGPASSAPPSSAPSPSPLSAPVEGAPTKAKKKSGYERRKEKAARAADGGPILTREVFETKKQGASRAGAAGATSAGKAQRQAELEAKLRAPDARAQMIRASSGALAGLFSVIAARRGDHWKLSELEKNGLGEAVADCLAPTLIFIGVDLTPFLPFVTCIGLLWAVISERAEIDNARAAVGSRNGAPAPTAPAPAPAAEPARLHLIGEIPA